MGRLFGTDGVRGRANVDLTPELAMAVAAAAARTLGDLDRSHPPVAVVGRGAEPLAETLAGWIRDQTGGAVRLDSRGRPLAPGDVLVLVRRRGSFDRALLRSLKGLGVPVAGLDRMLLTAQPAVQDLLALLGAAHGEIGERVLTIEIDIGFEHRAGKREARAFDIEIRGGGLRMGLVEQRRLLAPEIQIPGKVQQRMAFGVHTAGIWRRNHVVATETLARFLCVERHGRQQTRVGSVSRGLCLAHSRECLRKMAGGSAPSLRA